MHPVTTHPGALVSKLAWMKEADVGEAPAQVLAKLLLNLFFCPHHEEYDVNINRHASDKDKWGAQCPTEAHETSRPLSGDVEMMKVRRKQSAIRAIW
eukprot:5153925-Prymnesium_polylepis.3